MSRSSLAVASDDKLVEDIDLIHAWQPEATAKKLRYMYNEIKSLWNVAHADFKKPGSHAPWASFCNCER